VHSLPERIHLGKLLRFLGVDCVFDVGAHQGEYAGNLRKRMRYDGQIVSFEPIPELAANLRKKAVNDASWRIEEIALGSETGRRPFNVMKSTSFSSLSMPNHQEVASFRDQNVPVNRISVQTDTLVNVYHRLRQELGFKTPFLKLDTQGFDVEIVRTGRDVMKNFVGLQSELAVKRIYQHSVDFREALSLYQELGFELSALVPNNAGHFPVLVEIDCIMVRSDLLDLA
jgi:FkbM family methyltransferase